MNELIDGLSYVVDEVIHKCMIEFKELGKKSKALSINNKEEMLQKEDEVSQIYVRMAQIFNDLSPFEAKVRKLYPEMEELFNLLTS